MKTRRGLLLSPKRAPDNQLAEKRGVVAQLMARSKRYCHYPLAYVSAWIDPALVTNQLTIFYRKNDSEPVGFITWALMSPDVERRWVSDPRASLHISEWNEDGKLWIIDFMAMPGYCEDIVEFIHESMFQDHAHARYQRRNPNGSIRKTCHWKRRMRAQSNISSRAA